eukprot:Rhum_TRINITY_DN13129_c0_g2::Rhum_TRINITY_DN13129_c0_g2_i1::g.56974::m.56974
MVAHVHARLGTRQALRQHTLDVGAPTCVVCLVLQRREKVEGGRVRRRLCPRVRHVAGRVQPLRRLHGLVRRHAERLRGNLQQLDGVQGGRTPAGVALRRHRRHLRLAATLAALQQQLGHGVVEDAVAVPLTVDGLPVLLDDGRQTPERLRLEVRDVVVTLHDEAERRRLARTVADDARVEVAVAPLEVLRLVAREGDAHLQVKLLPCVDGVALVLVRLDQVVHRVDDLRLRDGGELRPPDAVPVVHALLDAVQHLEADVLALPVAVEPEHDVRAPLGLVLEVCHDACAVRGLLLLHLRVEEEAFLRRRLPVLVRRVEVHAEHVPHRARELEQRVLPAKAAAVLEHGAGARRAHHLCRAPVRQQLGDGVREGRLLRHHQDGAAHPPAQGCTVRLNEVQIL